MQIEFLNCDAFLYIDVKIFIFFVLKRHEADNLEILENNVFHIFTFLLQRKETLFRRSILFMKLLLIKSFSFNLKSFLRYRCASSPRRNIRILGISRETWKR